VIPVTRCRNLKVRADAEVVAGPYTVYRFVEDTHAGGDLEGRSVLYLAHHNVVDPAAQIKYPIFVLGGHQLIARGERMAWLPGCVLSQASW
jgi:hypothetical protein